MTKFFQVVALIVIISNLTINFAFSDVVEFKSGYSIKGKIVYANDKIVKIRQNKVTLEISRTQVKNIMYSQPKSEPRKIKTVSITENKKSEPVKIVQAESESKKNQAESMSGNKKPEPVKIAQVKTEAQKPISEPLKVELRPKLNVEEVDSKEISFLDKGSGVFSDKPKTTSKSIKTPSTNIFVKDEVSKKNLKNTDKVVMLENKPIVKPAIPRLENNNASISYRTLVRGVNSETEYLGVYNSDEQEFPLQVNISTGSASRLSFNLHSQKNGILNPMPTSVFIVFLDKNSNQILTTKPIIMDVNNFVEWIKNLEEVVGIAGDKFVSTSIPANTKYIKIIGIKSDSRSSLSGYVSNVKLDDMQIMLQSSK